MKSKTTEKGFINRNNQKNLGQTQMGQSAYELECQECFYQYFANGFDIFQRKCPNCQNGKRHNSKPTEKELATTNSSNQNKSKPIKKAASEAIPNNQSTNKAKIISTTEEAHALIDDVFEAAEIARNNIAKVVSDSSPIELLFDMKFKEIGYEPLNKKHINLIEQLNQTFTYLVSIEAVMFLLNVYPQHSYLLNLGTTPGYDIESEDKSIIGEVFSATSPMSNGKLEKDMLRLHSNNDAIHKFSFYYSYNDNLNRVENLKSRYPDVQVIKVPFDFIGNKNHVRRSINSNE